MKYSNPLWTYPGRFEFIESLVSSSRLSKKRDWLVYGLVALGASFADMDFIPGLILGQAGRFHHSYFHSLGVAIGVALIARIFIKLIQPGSSFIKTGSFVFCLGLSHLLLDFFTEAPSGFPFFWPFTEKKFLSSIPIFPRVERAWGYLNLWSHDLSCLLVENFLLLPLWIISWRMRPFSK